MNRRTRRTAVAGRIAVAGLALSAVLSGCTFTSPKPITTPYAASDGTASQIEDASTGEVVRLRNFLVVAAEKDAPGVVAGAIGNDGTKPITVTLSVLDTTDAANPQPLGETKVDVQPGSLALVGQGGTAFDLAKVPTAPGTVLTIQAQTPGGSTRFPLPVLAPTQQYATLTPTAAPSAS